MSASAFHHTGYYHACHSQQPSYIRIDHDVPLIQTPLKLLIHANHQSGIVDQHINRFPFFGQRFQSCGSLLPVTYIKRKYIYPHTIHLFQFSLQFLQLRHDACIQNQVPSLFCKLTGTTFTNSATGTGNKNNFSFHYVSIYNISWQKYALSHIG